MKFAFSSNAFLRFDLLEAIRIISAAGYEGIEIMADVPHAYPLHLSTAQIRDIRASLDKARLQISNINAFMHHADGDTYHPSWIERDPELRAKRVAYTLRCVDLAKQLGAPAISTEPGGPLDGMEQEQGLRLYREGLSAVQDRAKEKGVRILIEPEPGLLIENSTQFLDLFNELDPEVFGINFDAGHFFCVNEDPSELIHKLRPMIHHVHLEDIAATRIHHHLQLGHGAMDIPGILNTLESVNYQGFVTVELYTYEHAAPEAAKEALEYIKLKRMKNDHNSQ